MKKDCTHDTVTTKLNIQKEISSITCNECGYAFSVPEFKKSKFKEVNVVEAH